MSPSMASFLLSLCLANTAVVAFPNLQTTRVGPASWLDPLTDKEIQQIRDECYPTPREPSISLASNDSIAYSTGLEERIIGGELTPPGTHKAAIVFKGGSFCGGTIVSRRHILTAAHCIIYGVESVRAGGLCVWKGKGCPATDMVELKLDVAMGDFHERGGDNFGGDFAIVQLKRSQALDDAWASGRLEIDCLPAKGKPIDGEIILRGWGHVSQKAESVESHLRNVTMWTTTMANQQGITGIGYSECRGSDKFCLVSPISTERGSALGDSGGGAVKWNASIKHHTIYGIINGAYSGLIYNEHAVKVDKHVMVEAKVDFYIDDLCYHVGLCAPGVEREEITLNDLQMELPTTLEFTASRRRTDFPELEPFKMLSPEEAEAISKRCSSPSDYSASPIEKRDYPFVGFVADLDSREGGNGGVKMLCTATLITLRHAITSRQCIMAAGNATTGPPQWKLAVAESCWRDSIPTNASNCPLLSIEFIVWNSDLSSARRDLALIQLKEPVRDELIQQGLVSIACVKNESFRHLDYLNLEKIRENVFEVTVQYRFHDYHAFGWVKGKGEKGPLAVGVKSQGDSLYPQQGPLNETYELRTRQIRPPTPPPGSIGLRPFYDYDCLEEKLICMPNFAKEALSSGGMEPGWGLHDRLGDGKLVGLFVKQLDKEVQFEDEQVRVNAYVDAHRYLADFCVYLNLCYAPDQTFHQLMIPYFDRFLHF